MKRAESGIRVEHMPAICETPLSVSRIAEQDFGLQTAYLHNEEFTRFEKLLIACLRDLSKQSAIDFSDKGSLLIVTTTKGNIDLLETSAPSPLPRSRVKLHEAALAVARYFNAANNLMVISNACISGSLGIIHAADLIAAGHYEHVVVAGADVLTNFVLAGFVSFKAVSENPCMPFDKNRCGITPGEAAAAVLLSADKLSHLRYVSGASGNDATHISAPSREGVGLKAAIQRMRRLAQVDESFVPDTINAHGTATPYNDEMECRTFQSIGWQQVPVNSYKGFWGHTFGAAGVIETALLLESMKQNVLLPSVGFSQADDYNHLPVIATTTSREITTAVKAASGFGGCNAAFLIAKT